MTYLASNNGLTIQWFDPAPDPVGVGFASFDHYPSDAELRAAFPAFASALVSASISAALATQLALGLTVTSLGPPGFTATYALDQTTLEQIGALARDCAMGLGLPRGKSALAYPDIDGRIGPPLAATRDGSPGEYIALYRALRDYVDELQELAAQGVAEGVMPEWPTPQAQIP